MTADHDPAIRAAAEALCRKRHPQRFIAISSSQCECTECYEYARIAVEVAAPLFAAPTLVDFDGRHFRHGYVLALIERVESAERERDEASEMYRQATLAATRLGEEAARLHIKRDDLRAENMCDACGGTGTPESGPPCMCGGTGKMSDAARYLREQFLTLRADMLALADEWPTVPAAVLIERIREKAGEK